MNFREYLKYRNLLFSYNIISQEIEGHFHGEDIYYFPEFEELIDMPFPTEWEEFNKFKYDFFSTFIVVWVNYSVYGKMLASEERDFILQSVEDKSVFYGDLIPTLSEKFDIESEALKRFSLFISTIQEEENALSN